MGYCMSVYPYFCILKSFNKYSNFSCLVVITSYQRGYVFFPKLPVPVYHSIMWSAKNAKVFL